LAYTSVFSINITTLRTSAGSLGANHATVNAQTPGQSATTFYAVIDGSTGWMFAIGYITPPNEPLP
jgi:hypothetical protein